MDGRPACRWFKNRHLRACHTGRRIVERADFRVPRKTRPACKHMRADSAPNFPSHGPPSRSLRVMHRTLADGLMRMLVDCIDNPAAHYGSAARLNQAFDHQAGACAGDRGGTVGCGVLAPGGAAFRANRGDRPVPDSSVVASLDRASAPWVCLSRDSAESAARHGGI